MADGLKRHRRFSADGTWGKLLNRLLTEADATGEIDWTVSIDSTIDRAISTARP